MAWWCACTIGSKKSTAYLRYNQIRYKSTLLFYFFPWIIDLDYFLCIYNESFFFLLLGWWWWYPIVVIITAAVPAVTAITAAATATGKTMMIIGVLFIGYVYIYMRGFWKILSKTLMLVLTLGREGSSSILGLHFVMTVLQAHYHCHYSKYRR